MAKSARQRTPKAPHEGCVSFINAELARQSLCAQNGRLPETPAALHRQEQRSRHHVIFFHHPQHKPPTSLTALSVRMRVLHLAERKRFSNRANVSRETVVAPRLVIARTPRACTCSWSFGPRPAFVISVPPRRRAARELLKLAAPPCTTISAY